MSRLRLLAVCEDPPVDGEPTSAGHTLISQQVLARLADDLDITLVYFGGRDIERERFPAGLTAVHRIPLAEARSWRAWEPRAVAARTTSESRAIISTLALNADVTYLHGLSTFAFAKDVRTPVVVNEIDPFSMYWLDRAEEAGGKDRAAMKLRAARLQRTERLGASLAHTYIVVNERDARDASAELGREVVAVPNGVRHGLAQQPPRYELPTLIFVGSLDYAPNIDSATMLSRKVLPLVRRQVPRARVMLVGRNAGVEVRSLIGPGVEVHADVPDVMEPLSRAHLAAFPGGFGRGTRNSVLEALRGGTPVVASDASARGIPKGPHLELAETPEEFAAVATLLLSEGAAAEDARRQARAAGAMLPDWDDVAKTYEGIFAEAARPARALP